MVQLGYQRGKGLKQGDLIGLTAPAGPVELGQLEMAIFTIEAMGFQVKVGQTCYENYGGYLAGSPQLRADELNAMFAHPKIAAIFCLRGGYGSPQLLDKLDYGLIQQNPKLFVGYSDITALHIAFQQKANLATIHGPMPASDLISTDNFTIQSLLNILKANHSIGIIKNPGDEKIGCLVPGFAHGVLTGGNLTLVTSLLGTPYEIDTKGKILLLEDIGETPYKIDRMLTQLALAGKFSDASGIVLGSWTDCQPKGVQKQFQIEDLFENIIAPFGKPTIYNVRVGHCNPTCTLPLGINAYLEADARILFFKGKAGKSS